jgi:hypothetical protein
MRLACLDGAKEGRWGMAKCRYCGQEAGFLHSSHPECRTKHDQAMVAIREQSEAAVKSSKLDGLPTTVKGIAEEAWVSQDEQRQALVQAWEATLDEFLEDGVFSADEESKLATFASAMGLTQADLDRHGEFMKAAKAAALREVLEGRLPKSTKIEGAPFVLKRDEQLVWLFNNVSYFEQRTSRTRVGRSSGVSIRIAKGLYYRPSSFTSHVIERTETVHADTGVLGVTNQGLYFVGPSKSLRIPYGKVVSFTAYKDGIGLVRDAANARPQSFQTNDGWFTYNLVNNLAEMKIPSAKAQ